jgi:molecular chaperone IbpA
MRTDFDFTPYRRSTVGFDHLFDLLEKGQRGETGLPPRTLDPKR